MKKKYIAIFLCGIMVLSNHNIINAESFEGREDEMNKKCAVIYDSKTQAECSKYKEYLKQKSNSLEDEIGSIQNEINAAKGNVEKTAALLKKNTEEVNNYESLINDIQATITATEESIRLLDEKMLKASENIEKRDALMRDKMKSSQEVLGMNEYVDFLMGSNDLVDLIRRSQALGKLQQHEKKEIEMLGNEKAELLKDKQRSEEHKSLLEVQKQDINVKKEKVIALQKANETLLIQYQQQEAALLEQKRSVQMQQATLPKIDVSLAEEFDKVDPVVPAPPIDQGDGGQPSTPDPTPPPLPPAGSASFISPLQYGWHYESGTWQYPGGGGHMGMDFSTLTQTGIPVVAPGDGIIIYSSNSGCDNSGSSGCGIPWGGGNNTLLLTKKDNTIYAMPFYHLTNATRSAGTRVNQGDVIGYSGNSGNSTGPHTHVEVIRVGTMSMSEALSIYNRNGDLTFGTGWNANSPNACGIAPCRERPESYWR